MKGLIALFLVVSLGGIVWGYTSRRARRRFLAGVRKNLFSIVLAALVVAAAIFISVNTSLRLV